MEQQKAFIVKKLFVHHFIGGKHTAIEHLSKGIAGHLKGGVKHAASELVKEGILIIKPTSYGLQVSLNPEKMEEIKYYLQSFYKI